MCRKCRLSRSEKYLEPFFIVSIVVFISGCSSQQGGMYQSNNAGWSWDKERLRKAAWNALMDSQTLVPVAGAALFTIDDWDERLSDRASDDNPIFGSRSNAKDFSDYMLWSLLGETVITGLYVSGDNNPYNPDLSKTDYLLMEGVGVGGAAGIAGILESITDRTRPNGKSNSFPSGHATASFAAITMSNRSLDSMNLSDSTRTALQVGNILLASSVAWARVESRQHYPSDVLAGAALGHFFSAFIYDGFMDKKDNRRFEFMFTPYKDGAALSFGIKF